VISSGVDVEEVAPAVPESPILRERLNDDVEEVAAAVPSS
jgi:hypothetical protein